MATAGAFVSEGLHLVPSLMSYLEHGSFRSKGLPKVAAKAACATETQTRARNYGTRYQFAPVLPRRRSYLIIAFSFQSSGCEISHGHHIDRLPLQLSDVSNVLGGKSGPSTPPPRIRVYSSTTTRKKERQSGERGHVEEDLSTFLYSCSGLEGGTFAI